MINWIKENEAEDEYRDATEQHAATDAAVPVAREQLVDEGLAALKQADPAFDPDPFLAAAKEAFLKVKAAWQARDLAPVEGYLGDPLLTTLRTQADDMRRQGVRNVLDGLEVQDEHFAAAAVGDRLVLRFDAIAAHYALNDAGQIVFGDRDRKPFTEFWTFARPAGSRTYVTDTTTCATCGAPLNLDATGRCRYCGAVEQGGTLGWRAVDIREDLDWSE